MRVIAGSAGGLRLEVPKAGVRPTMDRVKAAIFSMLGDKVIGARVLDLFAGAGGLGIEALSRGAASVTFVEKDRSACAAIERNLRQTGLKGIVRNQEVFRFLEVAEAVGYDIVIADPPYENAPGDQPFTGRLLHDPSLAALLSPDGLLVLEKRPGEQLSEVPLWEMLRARTYGATEVLLLQKASRSAAE